ncbi:MULTISPECIES: hypothetical protein [unclassified Pseudoalteromonas]|uniref:hypothetical protein n=1 Tax=unclassified Pseudoalteromonas TaxID=194690 RepID=UPI002175E3E6|nr:MULTISPECIES: hypothetical protein [unclassified Pseudoalteromonas]
MKDGEVMVCISSSPEPVNGGLVSPLGAIRYKAIASSEFIKRHKINDLLLLAHLLSDLDKLQHQFLNDLNGSTPLFIHIYPSSEGFKQTMTAGLGYGLLPTLQLGDSLIKEELVDLFPQYYIDTPLYWHYWQTESPQLKILRKFALQVAGKRLEPIN